MFPTLSKSEIIILATFNLSSANAFNLDQSRSLLFGKELTCVNYCYFYVITVFPYTGLSLLPNNKKIWTGPN